MDLRTARVIIDSALAEGRHRDAKPLAVIVLDAGGHPVAFCREDEASLFRLDIARAKAMGALGMGADTRELAARAIDNPIFFTTVAIASQGNLVLSAGGVLIRDRDRRVSGAVGISGDAADVDEACALAGIAAVELNQGTAS